uniref:Uncharacterized protein n=1 Tax=Triticum urartu TaxID=4572 RepID=A0A8R7TPG2_TRIUA
MRLKRAMARPGPSLQAGEGGARASVARKLFNPRSGTAAAWPSNSPNRWCASSRVSVPARTRSVAAAKAARGAREGSLKEEVKMEDRRAVGIAGRFQPSSTRPLGRCVRPLKRCTAIEWRHLRRSARARSNRRRRRGRERRRQDRWTCPPASGLVRG